MATKLIHKKSSAAGSVPVAGDLQPGELAVNLADKKIYSKTTGGTIIELSSSFSDNGWSVSESGGSLYFAKDGNNKMKLDAAGNLDVKGNINTNATIS